MLVRSKVWVYILYICIYGAISTFLCSMGEFHVCTPLRSTTALPDSITRAPSQRRSKQNLWVSAVKHDNRCVAFHTQLFHVFFFFFLAFVFLWMQQDIHTSSHMERKHRNIYIPAIASKSKKKNRCLWSVRNQSHNTAACHFIHTHARTHLLNFTCYRIMMLWHDCYVFICLQSFHLDFKVWLIRAHPNGKRVQI